MGDCSKKREKYRRTVVLTFLLPPGHVTCYIKSTARKMTIFGVYAAFCAPWTNCAAHFGHATPSILHYWYPVFDRAVHHYSPGTELYLRLVESSPQLAITQIEMGYGSEIFKSKIVTHGIT